MSSQNPYDVPGTLDPQPYQQSDRERLRAIAKAHGNVNMVILVYLLLVAGNIALRILGPAIPFSGVFGLLIGIAGLGVLIFGAIAVFRLAKILHGTGLAVVFAVGMIIPCVGLILLLVLSQSATKQLQAGGIRVGLLGANPSSI
jgi:hypothetical protein